MATIHGCTNTRLYNIWSLMRRRCGAPRHPDYHRYGGRGIAVCSAWDNFLAFQSWAFANGYGDNLTIDRQDNDLGYEPGNCQWITRKMQNRNRRDNIRYRWRGRDLLLSEISEITGVTHDLLRQRVRRDGWDVERAASTSARPVRPYKRKSK